MTLIHNLKCVQPWFSRVSAEEKTVEIRKYDRNFNVGDRLCLSEYDPEKKTFSGRYIEVEVLHIFYDHEFEGLAKGYCAMSILKLKEGN